MGAGASDGSDEGAELFEAGRYEEALAVFERSVIERRAQDGRADQVQLAADLNNVGMCMGKLRRFERAVEPFREATDIYARLWRDDDDSFGPFYAAAMASLAGVLTEVRRYDEALDVTSVVVFLRRSPAAPKPELAHALRQFAHTRALSGKELDRALPAASEAVTFYHQLATESPERYVHDWSLAGHVLAAVLDALARPADAAKVRAHLASALQPQPGR